MNLGERVRERRRERGMTLAQVAGDELSVALVSKIERGLVSPSLSTLEVLAQRLGVTPGALLEERRDRGGAAAAAAAARTYVLLGDPARANDVAEQALSSAEG